MTQSTADGPRPADTPFAHMDGCKTAGASLQWMRDWDAGPGMWVRTCSCRTERRYMPRPDADVPPLPEHHPHTPGCEGTAQVRRDEEGGLWMTRCSACDTVAYTLRGEANPHELANFHPAPRPLSPEVEAAAEAQRRRAHALRRARQTLRQREREKHNAAVEAEAAELLRVQ